MHCREGNETIYSHVDISAMSSYLYHADRYFMNRENKPDSLQQALACYQAALDIAIEINHLRGKFEACFGLKNCMQVQNNFVEGKKYYDLAVKFSSEYFNKITPTTIQLEKDNMQNNVLIFNSIFKSKINLEIKNNDKKGSLTMSLKLKLEKIEKEEKNETSLQQFKVLNQALQSLSMQDPYMAKENLQLMLSLHPKYETGWLRKSDIGKLIDRVLNYLDGLSYTPDDYLDEDYLNESIGTVLKK